MIKNSSAKDNNLSGSFPISRLFPNIVTLIGLCFGLFAIKHAMAGKWEVAVMFIIVAGVIDGVDGRLARFLNASSSFGAQLDSLTDFVNFGVAPALILYMWQTHEVKGLGWAIALFFIICQAIRLARFNVSLEDDSGKKKISDNFFIGMPAPVGAGMSLLPMILEFLSREHFNYFLYSPNAPVTICYMAFIAVLMVSRIPTISIKKTKIKREYTSLALAMFSLLIISLILEPWLTLALIGVGYLLTIPLSVLRYYQLNN